MHSLLVSRPFTLSYSIPIYFIFPLSHVVVFSSLFSLLLSFNLFSDSFPFSYSSHYFLLCCCEGVREHCQFLKQIEDASSLRKAIAYCFERANIPSLSKQEIRDALSFVIVGAGPTGVRERSFFTSFPYHTIPLQLTAPLTQTTTHTDARPYHVTLLNTIILKCSPQLLKDFASHRALNLMIADTHTYIYTHTFINTHTHTYIHICTFIETHSFSLLHSHMCLPIG